MKNYNRQFIAGILTLAFVAVFSIYYISQLASGFITHPVPTATMQAASISVDGIIVDALLSGKAVLVITAGSVSAFKNISKAIASKLGRT